MNVGLRGAITRQFFLSTANLTVEQRGVQKLHPLIFLEYLSCPSEFSIVLRRIPRATKA